MAPASFSKTLLLFAALVLLTLPARGQTGPHYLGIPQSTWTYEVADTLSGHSYPYSLDITALQPIRKNGHTWYRVEVVRREADSATKDTIQIDSTRSYSSGGSDSCGLNSWLPDTLAGPYPRQFTLEGREYRTKTHSCSYYEAPNINPRYYVSYATTSIVEERIGLIFQTGYTDHGPLVASQRTTFRLVRFNGQPFDADGFKTVSQSAIFWKSPNPALAKPTLNSNLFWFEGLLHDIQGRARPPIPLK